MNTARLSVLYWVVLAGVAALQIAPLFLIKYLPLVDLPNHEARIAILAHYGSNPSMHRYYVSDWRPIPDMAFDLFAVPLVRLGLTPVEAGRCFLAVAALLYVDRRAPARKAAAGKRSWLGVILPFLFYSSALFYGFVNFVFGFGAFLVVYGLWLRWHGRMTYRRTAAVAALLLVSLTSPTWRPSACSSTAIVVTVAFDGPWDGRRAPTASAPCWRSSPRSSCSSTARRRAGAAEPRLGGLCPRRRTPWAGATCRTTTSWMRSGSLGVVVIAVAAVVLSRSIEDRARHSRRSRFCSP